MLELLDNALLQGLAHAPAAIGLVLSLRVIRYPDLTADGSFMIGSTVFAALLAGRWGGGVAVLGAVAAGALAGLLTAVLNSRVGVNRILSGLLTSMICYSVAFHVLDGRPNVGLLGLETPFTAAERADAAAPWTSHGVHLATGAVLVILVGALVSAALVLLRSDLGLMTRAVGTNEGLVADLGKKPALFRTLGLVFANLLVALSGSVTAARDGFSDVNRGVGVIIVLIAAIVLGEEALRLFGTEPNRSVPVLLLVAPLGAFLYFFLYLLILRASLQGWLPVAVRPTDLKLLSALLIVLVYVVRRFGSRDSKAEPDLLPL